MYNLTRTGATVGSTAYNSLAYGGIQGVQGIQAVITNIDGGAPGEVFTYVTPSTLDGGTP